MITLMRVFFLLPLVALSACSLPPFLDPFSATPTGLRTPSETLDPTPPPPPPVTAVTAEQFDTTTEADRAAAIVEEPAAEDRLLGTTIASLGPPADPGIWLETPLVSVLTPGRIDYLGTSINVELRPSGGTAGSGSQISLAAMRLIAAPLTSLPELQVFAVAP